jgi:hypothetical protein
MLKLSARFGAVLAVAAMVIGAAIILAEMVLQAPLTFGIAVVAVLPMLIAARSCGAAWVQAQQIKPSFGFLAAYGLWFASLSLIFATLAATILTQLHLINLPSFAPMANRPFESLAILLLAFATCSLITITGFALGVRTQMRHLPNQ